MARFFGKRKWLLAGVIALACFLSFEAYRAFYPGEAFYRSEFERVAATAFPGSGSFIFKSATFPDLQGAYQSCGLFTVDEADYASLLSHISTQANQGAAQRLVSVCRQDQSEAPSGSTGYREVARGRLGNEYREWGLLDDGRTVFFDYASW